MDIIETIASHTAALRMPLYAVTASAIRKADTPLILTLHWHGFHRDGTADGGLRSVAGSAVQLNLRWRDFAVLDRAIIDAGWALGAWDVERLAPALVAPERASLGSRGRPPRLRRLFRPAAIGRHRRGGSAGSARPA